MTLKTDTSKKLEFPGVGDRDSSGALESVGAYGYYWSSVARSSGGAYALWFLSSGMDSQGNFDKHKGFSVRCVRQ